MKKILRKIIHVFGLVVLSSSIIIYADVNNLPDLNSNNTSKQDVNIVRNDDIVYASSSEVALNSDFYIILNLTKIDYSKFKVEITNTLSLSASDVTTDVSNLSIGSPTSFVVDKSLINLDKIGVVYTTPMQETVINFNVKITDLTETKEGLQTKATEYETEISAFQDQLLVLQAELELLEPGTPEYQAKQDEIANVNSQISSKTSLYNQLIEKINSFVPNTIEKNVVVTVLKETSKKSEDEKSSFEKELEMQKKEMSADMDKMKMDMSDMQSSLQVANDKITTLTQSVTYQGSQNNYLSSLSITGVEFSSSFKKTTLNYFATVGADITDLTINAEAEDSSAIVTIYGNKDLKVGKNKVIVTVTAEDGSTKNYIIYITKS